jgi:large subunit ribosomal protein L15
MDLSNLNYPDGARKTRKRKGRGVGSGNGKTAGRGHNGYYSRGGSKHRAAFEGGQMPLQRRVPKFGFTNINKVEYQIINIGSLNSLEADSSVTIDLMLEKGLIDNKTQPVKILGNGELSVKLSVSAHKFSKSAVESIEKAGGSTEVL